MIETELYKLMAEFETLEERNNITIGEFITYVKTDHGEDLAFEFEQFYKNVLDK